jgi:hypothetical protein
MANKKRIKNKFNMDFYPEMASLYHIMPAEFQLSGEKIVTGNLGATQVWR